MSYPPGVYDAFEESATRFTGEGRLVLYITTNENEACFTVGEIDYKGYVPAENTALRPEHFKLFRRATLPRESFNGVLLKDMVNAELDCLKQYKPYFDIIINDLRQGSRSLTLAHRAEKPARLVHDSKGYKIEELN